MIASIAQWAAAVLAVAGCVAMVVRLIRQEPEYERLYGRARGWPRFRSPLRHRVPGLPRDGVLTGQEEAAIEEIARQFREDRRP